MALHSCISCPDGTVWCCICAGPDHRHRGDPDYRAPGETYIPSPVYIPPPVPRCLKIIDVFDEPHRCSNPTDGFRAYCNEHMTAPTKSSRFDWDALVLVFGLVTVIAYTVGYLCYAWLHGAN